MSAAHFEFLQLDVAIIHICGRKLHCSQSQHVGNLSGIKHINTMHSTAQHSTAQHSTGHNVLFHMLQWRSMVQERSSSDNHLLAQTSLSLLSPFSRQGGGVRKAGGWDLGVGVVGGDWERRGWGVGGT